jgi:ornithine--oxo-acid transaminase
VFRKAAPKSSSPRATSPGRTTTIIGFSSEAQYRDGFGPFAPGFVSVPFGDATALEAAIKPETAAFLVEPVQGEAGIIVPPAGYLARAREICTRHGHPPDLRRSADRPRPDRALLACDHDGIRPDGLVLGKALGGGLLPVSAFLARADVMAVFAPGDHGSTFGGNPLAAAVGEAALDLLVRERLSERARVRGDELLAKLRAIEHPAIAEVRGKGLLIGVEIDPAVASARTVCEGLLARGVLSKDTHGTVVRFAPPLVVESEHVDLAVGALTEALRSLPTRVAA